MNLRRLAAERAAILARDDWGRIVALLASRDGDIAGAEDAVATALERALRTWAETGVPDNPSGWVYRVALNARRDVWKSAAARTSVALDDQAIAAVDASSSAGTGADAGGRGQPDLLALPDRRLELLAACAHPDIEPAARPLLMLSAVMGLTGARIAAGMVLPASTVAARLTRAKAAVRRRGLSVRFPGRDELPDRLPAIHEAVYAIFSIEWAHASPDIRDGLIGEALHLAELIAALCPDSGESHGLAALLSLSAARFPARRSSTDAVVPLEEQDPDLWDERRVAVGEHHLREAHRCGVIGRFGIEAAIQALHMQGVRTGRTDWPALLRMHDHLLRVAPSIGARVSRAAVVARVDGPHAGIAELDALPRRRTEFQPAWVLRAHLLADLGDARGARAAFERALSLTTVTSEARHLRRVMAERTG